MLSWLTWKALETISSWSETWFRQLQQLYNLGPTKSAINLTNSALHTSLLTKEKPNNKARQLKHKEHKDTVAKHEWKEQNFDHLEQDQSKPRNLKPKDKSADCVSVQD